LDSNIKEFQISRRPYNHILDKKLIKKPNYIELYTQQIYKMRVLVFDTETTGLPETRDRCVTGENLHLWPHILQLSYIVFDTDKQEIVEVFDTMIQIADDVVISEGSMKCHNITREISNERGNDIKSSLLFLFTSVAEADLLVGHNINFDLNMVRAEMLRNGPELMKYTNMFETKRKFCTMKESTAFCCIPSKFSNSYNRLKPPKLIELHQKLFNGETPTGLHNSLTDVKVTLRCFMKLRYDLDIQRTEN